MDSEEEPKEISAEGLAFADEQQGVEAFRRLLFLCLPPQTYGQVRLGPAAQRRFIATVYVVAPEVFGGKSQGEMADMLGMREDQFKKDCRTVRATLAARKPAK